MTKGMATKGAVVRRLTIGLVTVGMFGGMLAESASAQDLTVRHDPPDASFQGNDYRTVATDTIPHRVVLKIGTWDPYDLGPEFEVVSMDMHGTRAVDRLVFVTNGGPDHGFRCRVTGSDGRGVIGRRNARRPTERGIACNLPRSWFDIHKVVRFRVQGCCSSQLDRAPNRGWYVGLSEQSGTRKGT